ncbi:MAG: DUF6531 domain-containing protein, partial [Parachlamydiaceae bacterium]
MKFYTLIFALLITFLCAEEPLSTAPAEHFLIPGTDDRASKALHITSKNTGSPQRPSPMTPEECKNEGSKAFSEYSLAEFLIGDYIKKLNSLPLESRIELLKKIDEHYQKAIIIFNQVIHNCEQNDKKGKTWRHDVVKENRANVNQCHAASKRVIDEINNLTTFKTEQETSEKIEKVNQLWNASTQKNQQANEIRDSVVHSLKNTEEMSNSLNAAALLYNQAADNCRAGLALTDKPEEKTAFSTSLAAAENNAATCRKEAVDWTNKVLAHKQTLREKLTALRNEAFLLEADGPTRYLWEVHQQIESVIKKLIECDECNAAELVAVQTQIALCEAAADTRHLTPVISNLSMEEFYDREDSRKGHFFSNEAALQNVVGSTVIPLDGASLYTEQFYRFLIQSDSSTSSIRVNVYENGAVIHEEQIALPKQDTPSWHYYLATDEMIIIPNMALKSQFGLDLRISIVSDPNYNLSLLIAHKASTTNYTYTFSLEETPLYTLNFTPPPPWQLDVLRKPTLPSSDKSLSGTPITVGLPSDLQLEASTKNSIHYPILDRLVKDMKNDPLAIVQYVYNEIELVTPTLAKNNEIFQPCYIDKNVHRTFLEKQGSSWEQCDLLVYLLRQAGYQAIYIEGVYSLPARVAERLLFIQLPDENEIKIKYPGVLLHVEGQWITLFPWMKDIHVNEGQDLYASMPDEYANADRWIKRYLCNDENILKHIRADGDDSAGVLFVRFLEEQLKNKGLSLQDVGTHRTIQKKRYASWNDFLCPLLDLNTCRIIVNLADKPELYTKVKIEVAYLDNPETLIDTGWLILADIDCQFPMIDFVSEDTALFLTLKYSDEIRRKLLNTTDKIFNVNISFDRYGTPSTELLVHTFPLVKGTAAAICFHFGDTSGHISCFFAEQYAQSDTPQEKLQALLAFTGTAYFEKCSRASKLLTSLHKVTSRTWVHCGLSKLAPETTQQNDKGNFSLIFPQVDMQHFYQWLPTNFLLFSKYQQSSAAFRQCMSLVCIDESSNEHQILREIYQDPYAISTVKLLQITNRQHQTKGLPDFLILTNENIAAIELTGIAAIADTQWKMVKESITKGENDSYYAYAYMTPNLVESLDGDLINLPSYQGMGIFINHPLTFGALISQAGGFANGGFGSRLPECITYSFTSNKNDFTLISNGNNYGLRPLTPLPDVNNDPLPSFSWNSRDINALNWRADVHPEHKSKLDSVADPVDITTGAFYVDETDLSLPGLFPLEIRRNYNSQNPIPGPFGCGWKLSLNPFLGEEENKLYAAEMDGTVIVYTLDPDSSRWIVLAEDNPDLRNHNQKG